MRMWVGSGAPPPVRLCCLLDAEFFFISFEKEMRRSWRKRILLLSLGYARGAPFVPRQVDLDRSDGLDGRG